MKNSSRNITLKVMAKAGCIEKSLPSAINGGVIIIPAPQNKI